MALCAASPANVVPRFIIADFASSTLSSKIIAKSTEIIWGRVKITQNSEKLGFYSPEVFDKSKPKDSLKTASFFSAMACISWTKRKENITNLHEPHPSFNFQQSFCSAIVFPLIHPCPLSNVVTCNDDNKILG